MKMMVYFLLSALLFFSCKKEEKSTINFQLKKELAEMELQDQFVRKITDKTPKDSLVWFAKKIKIDSQYFINNYKSVGVRIDGENQRRIEKIIQKYGYPGKSLVGTPENHTTWLIIQHSSPETIKKYLSLLREATQKGELEKTALALAEDRNLMYQHKEQIYGSQAYGNIGMRNGKEFSFNIIWPIKNPEKVNELRKSVGFTQTVEEYAKDLYGKDFVYKVYTIKEVDYLQKAN